MFGLMKHSPRLPYCGTCKALGALYGQRARLLLNRDTVFLAEILLEAAGESLTGPAYRSYNCLSLPKYNDIPLALQYAAAITVTLAHFRIADHREDALCRTKRWAWKGLAKCLSPRYVRAAAKLRGWGFPLDEMSAILATQPAREARARSIADVAEPTKKATALVFSHGMRTVGRPDMAEAAYRMGSDFGELIYLLDAYEDRERDSVTGDFNAFLTFAELSPRHEILAVLERLCGETPPNHAERLKANVQERLGLRPRVLEARLRRSFRDRVRDAAAFARTMQASEGGGWLKGAAVLTSVAVLAMVFPEHARRTDSWHQCLGLPLNLMALGAVFAASPPVNPGPHRPPEVLRGPLGPAAPNVSDCGAKIRGSCFDCCAEGLCEAACESCG